MKSLLLLQGSKHTNQAIAEYDDRILSSEFPHRRAYLVGRDVVEAVRGGSSNLHGAVESGRAGSPQQISLGRKFSTDHVVDAARMADGEGM